MLQIMMQLCNIRFNHRIENVLAKESTSKYHYKYPSAHNAATSYCEFFVLKGLFKCLSSSN